MTGREKFELAWANFAPSFTSALREIRDDSSFFDITLLTGTRQQQISAHRLVLSACSTVFRNILKNMNTNNHTYLYLKGVQYEMLTSILDFMYQGSVSVAQEDLSSFLDLAEELQVSGLTNSDIGKQTEKTKSTLASKSSASRRPGSDVTEVSVNGHKAKEKRKSNDKPEKRKNLEDEIKVSKVVNAKKRPRTVEDEPTRSTSAKRRQRAHIQDDTSSESSEGETEEELLQEAPRAGPSQIKTRSLLHRKAAMENDKILPVTKEEFLSDSSLGLKTEISITENLSDGSLSEVGNLSAEYRKDLDKLTCIASSVRPSDEDEEMLVTLTEALDALTKEYIIQVPDKSWRCLTCSQLFYAKQSCQNHIEAEHLEPGAHVCPTCIQKFPTIKSIREHVLSGHRKAGQPLDSAEDKEDCVEVEEDRDEIHVID